MFADRLIGIVRLVAQPSIVQLVLRLALSMPFWRSGVLKWDGFLQLNDTAVYLFTSEFMLHLPGGPYPYPAPAIDGVPVRLWGDRLSYSPCPRICDTVCGHGTFVHDLHRRTDRSRRLANSYHLGGNGAWHHGLGTRHGVAGLCEFVACSDCRPANGRANGTAADISHLLRWIRVSWFATARQLRRARQTVTIAPCWRGPRTLRPVSRKISRRS